MACTRLGRLRAPAMAFALRRELVRLGHRLFGAGAAYGARARLVRRRLVAGADHAAACDRGLAIGPLWARTGERHAGRRGYWRTCACCDPRFRDCLRGWNWSVLADLLGTEGPSQAGMGPGAGLVSTAFLMLLCQGLAGRGWCRGDAFIVGAIGVVVALTVIFVLFPVVIIL